MAMMMNFYFTLTVVQGQAPPPPPPPPPPPQPAGGDLWDGCSTMADIENNIRDRCNEKAYETYHCIKTCREYKAARQAPAADGAPCSQNYECKSNMCHDGQCQPSELDGNKFCRYHTTPNGHCEKGEKNICERRRTILKTIPVEAYKRCFSANNELKSACNCESERLENNAECQTSKQCKSEVCHDEKCVESTKDGYCMYHFSTAGQCQKVHKHATSTCERRREVLAWGSSNNEELGKTNGCYKVGSNVPETCSCDDRLDNNARCTESVQCKSEICLNEKCVESAKVGFCRYSLDKAGQCQRVHKNSTSTCERHRLVLAASSSNIAESNKTNGCYGVGSNVPETCSCDGDRLKNNTKCKESNQCESDICHEGTCVESFKHGGCAFSFGDWEDCRVEAKDKCKQRRQVKEIGFVTQRSCNSNTILHKLEKECACQATPATNTTTASDDATPETNTTTTNDANVVEVSGCEYVVGAWSKCERVAKDRCEQTRSIISNKAFPIEGGECVARGYQAPGEHGLKECTECKESDENEDCGYVFTEWTPCNQRTSEGCARVRTISEVNRVYPTASCFIPGTVGYPLELATDPKCECSSATPETNTTTTNDECTEWKTKEGKKYYHKANAKALIKSAWKREDCEAIV